MRRKSSREGGQPTNAVMKKAGIPEGAGQVEAEAIRQKLRGERYDQAPAGGVPKRSANRWPDMGYAKAIAMRQLVAQLMQRAQVD